ESDLLTFAQRKQHFETDKSFQQELFTGDTRPLSVRQLYTEAGKELPVAAGATAVVSSDHEVLQLNGSAGAEDQLLCVSEFGNANRKLRTRIDAEIEIRLPAAIEDLRKWTSSEALGDVTVTPDCMHHVDTSVSTSLVIGENGILTPALSPSVLSADANLSQAADSSRHNHHPQALIPNDINKDVPLNHRLPSPEEQTKQIALNGKHFQRMCAARKSTSGGYAAGTTAGSSSSTSPESAGQADGNNLDDNVQTVSRRSRSRKVRGKRRNTIAGIDQKEIQDAANGNGESKNASNATSPVAQAHQPVDATSVEAKKSKKFGRSKSSDILKKESAALPYDKGKNTLTRLNSLKQWGRNRFKFMQRTGELGDQLDTSGCSSQNSSAEKADSQHGSPSGERESPKRDIDDECVVHHLVAQKSESRFSHERKPSYSSSEKSMSVSSSGQLRGRLQLSSGSGPLAAAAHVKMRETATLNRQRRNGLHALAGKEEQPHSSSGNWSASSESGRASIGSEITMQPKSSASSTSLNVSTFQAGGAGSGPPSSMLSRRRFLNTSASSSVTSEGTATPELQAEAGAYPGHLDDETSSAYSCDTEGYYTSFHMDSGLRTLKEEEPSPMPGTPLQTSLHTSSYSFGSQSNQTVLNAESEYELFGRGSTSTTTSSAGTVCTALLSGAASGPDVPERSSSLGKHSGQSRSHSQSTSASSSTLERSYSSSTIGSTLERTGTIKRNVKMSPTKGESLEKEDGQQEQDDRQQQLEFSESSDLEGVERIERIKQKTAISSKRIPSMCIITPTTSDDDEHQAMDPNRTLTSSLTIEVDHNEEEADEDEPEQKTPTNSKDHNLNELKQTPTKALSGMFEKLRVKLVPGKSSPPQNQSQTQIQIPIQTMAKPANASAVNDDELYDLAGEYVTIADISNNNNNRNNNNSRRNTGMGIYYSSDIVSKRIQPSPATVAEYVSLNELPQHLRRHAVSSRSPPESESCAQQQLAAAAAAAAADSQPPQPPQPPSLEGRTKGEGVPMYAEIGELSEEKPLASASASANRRLRPNAEGKLVYDSDSLKRRKGAHTTFAPGPYVKETESALHSAESAAAAAASSSSSSSTTQDTLTGSGSGSVTKSAKLLLLSGGGLIAGNRKVANVRPILSKSPLSRNTNGGMATYQATTGSSYQEQKQLLANRTNPFYETIAAPVASLMMMPSPSGKSNSSTGSTATSSSSSASGHSGEEGKPEQLRPSASSCPTSASLSVSVSLSTATSISCPLVNNTAMSKSTLNQHQHIASKSSVGQQHPQPPQHPQPQNQNQNPKDGESKVRVAEMETNPLGDGFQAGKGQWEHLPPLPPRAKVNDKPPTQLLSIDPIALHFSLPVGNPGQPRTALKRNNSYRLANDELKLEMNKENLSVSFGSARASPSSGAMPLSSVQHATSSLRLRNLPATATASHHHSPGGERRIAKSFERLVDEFSLSLTTGDDSSYLKNKSLENFDDSPALLALAAPEQKPDETASDSESGSASEEDEVEFAPPLSLPAQKYHKSFVDSVLLRPFKIILPSDENGHRRQRILQKFDVTEIW
ncbi:hypothetical protein M5D96_000240, partial [Drosophila gunungcola]